MLNTVGVSIDRLEQSLVDAETQITRIRAAQLTLLRELDLVQVAAVDGCRSLTEWVASRLDITTDRAKGLIEAAKRLSDHPGLETELEAGRITVDRAVATARLADTGATAEMVAASAGLDLAGVARVTARHRRLTRRSERQGFRDRFLALQPRLDGSGYRLWGELPAVGGATVEAALTHRGDQFGGLPDGRSLSRTQRNADALVSISHDHLSGGNGENAPPAPAEVTVFIDAHLAAATGGEAGAELAAGPRVGPDTLDGILCDATVGVTMVDPKGRCVGVGNRSRTIPPQVRRYVLWRDGGCVADGCNSRYRLQPHHITPRSQGGDHDPANLATLCWFHHHIVIHGHGYRIDPHSPPQRRRFIPPEPAPDPP